MMRLKQEGYIIQPHTSAGSVPSDKGYRHYVETLDDIRLPLNQQRMINHLFHQGRNQSGRVGEIDRDSVGEYVAEHGDCRHCQTGQLSFQTSEFSQHPGFNSPPGYWSCRAR